MRQFYKMHRDKFEECKARGSVESDHVHATTAVLNDDLDDYLFVHTSNKEEGVLIFEALLEVDVDVEEERCALKRD